MPVKWKTVRVFISSTFRDMQAERDHLIRFVFPQLREVLLKRRIHLVDVDLRWGVTTEQDAMDVCREVITECKPRFLCMLGGRYGWTPKGKDRSITADEVHFAALDQKQPDEYHFFYFRDPAATGAIVERQPGEYREPPGGDNERKLKQLKREVVAAGFTPFVYQAEWNGEQQRLAKLQAFGERVYQDLLASIDDEFGTQPVEQLDEFAEEAAAMETFIEERVQRYVVGSRRMILDEIDAFANSKDAPSILVITGAPGSGKSALLGKFFEEYSAAYRQSLVIPHFIGASARSTDLRRTLRRLCRELGADADSLPQDMNELSRQFADLLVQASASQSVLLVIDALNQMDAADNAHRLNWLPRPMPANVRVIVSTLAHPVLEELRSRTEQVHELILEPLTPADSQAIIQDVLQRFHKRLSDAQIDLLLAKADSGNPLYLLTTLEELRTLGDYDEITRRIGDLPDQVRDLIRWILKERLSNDPGFRNASGSLVGAELVREFVSSIGVSRHGLSHSELVGVIDPGDPLGNVAALERLLRPFLMQRGELLDFYHGQFREAVDAEYLDEAHELLEAHRRLAAYFHSMLNPANAEPWSGDDPHALAELPYHQTQGESWEDLEATLCDLRFVQSKCTAVLTFDLVQDYAVALDALPELQEEREKELQRQQRLRQYGVDLIAYAKAKGEGVPLPTPPDTRGSLKSVRWAEKASNHSKRRFGAIGQAICGLRARILNSARFLPLPVPENIQVFANFVSAHSHLLDCFPVLTLPIAGNHAATGPVVEQAETLLQSFELPWMHRDPRPPAPPQRLLCLRTLEGHIGAVTSVALTADGSLAVSASTDKNLRVWDVNSGECLRTLEGHTDAVSSVALTPDGTCVISGSSDTTLRIWDVNSGECLRTLEGHTDSVICVGLTPDGKRAVSASWDNTLRVWDVDSGECLHTLFGFDCRGVVLSPDGKRAVSANENIGYSLRAWDIASDELVGGLNGFDCISVDVTPDGKRAISANKDNTLCVCDVDRWKCLRILQGHTPTAWRAASSQVYGVAVTPDGRRAVSASSDKTLRVWNVDRGECLRTLAGHTYRVHSVAVTPDGKRAISGSLDKTLRVWDIVSGECIRTLHGHADRVTDVVLTSDGNRAVSASWDNTLRVWDVNSGECLRTLQGHDGIVASVAFTSDGKQAVSASWDKSIRVWDVNSGECLRTLQGHDGIVTSVAFTSDGKRAVSASWDNTLRVWDVNSGECLHGLRGHTNKVKSVALTPDGKKAVSASDDHTLRVWDVDSGACLRTLGEHGGMCRNNRVFLTVDGNYAVSAGGDTLRVWDVNSGERLHRLRGYSNSVTSVALAPDGEKAEPASEDHTLRVWDFAHGEPLPTLEGHNGEVHYVALTSRGNLAVSASDDNILRVWDFASGECLRTLDGHTSCVRALALTPDGSRAISVSFDKTLCVWDLATGKKIAVYPLESDGSSVAVTADNRIIAGTAGGQLHFLKLRNWPVS